LKSIYLYLLLFTHCFVHTFTLGQQKVGVVLSGGGAAGLAHIGVLKALEESGIPIDYITGTSAGALVGSMYAAGYSPQEIESYVLSPDFKILSAGKIKSKQRFFYKESEVDASVIDFSFSRDSLFKKSLPTNFVSSAFLDFEMAKLLSTTTATYGNHFDSLFVPFRCVASDIANKKSIVFSDGNLNQAVRASLTYPFYFQPIRIDSVLLFDGGLYNNFPADVMYNHFDSDYIIGSNVTLNANLPMEDDLLSQITNMLVAYSNFNLPCESGILIEPKTSASTFEFEQIEQIIQSGYDQTIQLIDSIRKQVTTTVSKEEIALRRNKFKAKQKGVYISSISSTSPENRNIPYVSRSMLRRNEKGILELAQIEKRYYRLAATDQIEFLYPNLTKKKDSTYNLAIEIRKAKDFKLDVGGHISSRAVNTGYMGFSYRNIANTASTFHASSYFGKFYGSGKLSYTLEIPAVFPVAISGYFVLNRWDYFRSFATFFEDVKPSFLIQNEVYYGIKIKSALGNNAKSTFDIRAVNLEDNYYQSKNFTNKDTTDITRFNGFSSSWEYFYNTLNKKQFANSGSLLKVKIRFNQGEENGIPGSTSVSKDTIRKNHQWININTEYQKFVVDKKYFHLGIHLNGVFNSQSLFSNYTASLLSTTSFSLIPDVETYFLPEYRSPQFFAGGLNFVFSYSKRMDFRIDAYQYQPLKLLIQNEDGTASYSKSPAGETFIASASLIYHSLLGPLRATLNYFPKQYTKFAFQISYGFVLFNERAVR
jgi:NTE family protein